jgi:hypothetical protein
MTPVERANACRQQYGDAHDAHMEVNDECAWCGMWRDASGLHLSDADQVEADEVAARGRAIRRETERALEDRGEVL